MDTFEQKKEDHSDEITDKKKCVKKDVFDIFEKKQIFARSFCKEAHDLSMEIFWKIIYDEIFITDDSEYKHIMNLIDSYGTSFDEIEILSQLKWTPDIHRSIWTNFVKMNGIFNNMLKKTGKSYDNKWIQQVNTLKILFNKSEKMFSYGEKDGKMYFPVNDTSEIADIIDSKLIQPENKPDIKIIQLSTELDNLLLNNSNIPVNYIENSFDKKSYSFKEEQIMARNFCKKIKELSITIIDKLLISIHDEEIYQKTEDLINLYILNFAEFEYLVHKQWTQDINKKIWKHLTTMSVIYHKLSDIGLFISLDIQWIQQITIIMTYFIKLGNTFKHRC